MVEEEVLNEIEAETAAAYAPPSSGAFALAHHQANRPAGTMARPSSSLLHSPRGVVLRSASLGSDRIAVPVGAAEARERARERARSGMNSSASVGALRHGGGHLRRAASATARRPVACPFVLVESSDGSAPDELTAGHGRLSTPSEHERDDWRARGKFEAHAQPQTAIGIAWASGPLPDAVARSPTPPRPDDEAEPDAPIAAPTADSASAPASAKTPTSVASAIASAPAELAAALQSSSGATAAAASAAADLAERCDECSAPDQAPRTAALRHAHAHTCTCAHAHAACVHVRPPVHALPPSQAPPPRPGEDLDDLPDAQSARGHVCLIDISDI